MASVNEQLRDLAIQHEIRLRRYSRGVVGRISALLARADSAVATRLTQRLARDPLRATFTTQNVEGVLHEVRDLSRVAHNEALDRSEDALRELAAVEIDWQADAINVASPIDFRINRPSVDLVASAATAQPFQGKLLREWFSDMEESKFKRLRDTVRIGIVDGSSIDQIASQIRGFTDLTRRNAEAVVRTAVNHTVTAARDQLYAGNEDIIDKWMFVATLDGRTTMICLPASTRVSALGSVRALSRRFYEGEMVVITTAGGKEIKGTPNHPILTSGGWLPLNEIQPGEHVVYAAAPDSPGVVGEQQIDMPPSFAEIADAVFEPTVSTVAIEAASAVDFHGDGMTVDGEVHVARPKDSLGSHLQPGFAQEPENDALGSVDRPLGLSPQRRSLLHLIGWMPLDETAELAPAPLEDPEEPGFRSSPGKLSENFAWPGALLEELSRQTGVGLDELIPHAPSQGWHRAENLEEGSNGRNRSSVMPAQTGSGFTGSVAPENVIGVRREFAREHVFNLETDTGIYIANGLIIQNCIGLDGKTFPVGKGPRPPRHINCRSTTIPITKSWAEMGFDGLDEQMPLGSRPFVADTRRVKDIPKSQRDRLIGRVPADMTYGEWLATQSPAFQDEVLGPTRAKLFRDGGLKVDRFADDGAVYSLDELRRREARAFRSAFETSATPGRVPPPQPPLVAHPLTPGQLAANRASLTRYRSRLAEATTPELRAALESKIAAAERRIAGPGARVADVPPPPPLGLSPQQIAANRAALTGLKKRLAAARTPELRSSLQSRIAAAEARLAGSVETPPPARPLPKPPAKATTSVRDFLRSGGSYRPSADELASYEQLRGRTRKDGFEHAQMIDLEGRATGKSHTARSMNFTNASDEQLAAVHRDGAKIHLVHTHPLDPSFASREGLPISMPPSPPDVGAVLWNKGWHRGGAIGEDGSWFSYARRGGPEQVFRWVEIEGKHTDFIKQGFQNVLRKADPTGGLLLHHAFMTYLHRIGMIDYSFGLTKVQSAMMLHFEDQLVRLVEFFEGRYAKGATPDLSFWTKAPMPPRAPIDISDDDVAEIFAKLGRPINRARMS